MFHSLSINCATRICKNTETCYNNHMRIGLYDPYTDALGGGEKYMYTLAECLSQNHDVSIFWDRESDIEAIERRFSLSLKKTRIVKNIFTNKISLKQRISESRSYDRIIYLSDGSLPTLLTRNLLIHFQFPVEWITLSIATKIKFAQVRSVICNSQFTKDYIDKKFLIKSTVLYPPVDIKAKSMKKENIILHVGRFAGTTVEGTDYKKQGVMVEVFKKMIDKGLKDWKLIIAAGVKSEDENKFALMIQNAKNYPIEFLKNETNDALWETYAKAKIYWHASGYGEDTKKHPELAEHFGISTVESMGAGCVPVVINKGGQKEIVTDGVNGVLWNTEEEWIDKTSQLIENKDMLQMLSRAAKLRAEGFSKELFCQSIHALL